jgi:spermidine/putrescine transport system permease protein
MTARRRLAPYVLMAPGLVWLVLFFVLPNIQMGLTSVSSGRAGDLELTGDLSHYVDAISAFPEQFRNSLVYGGLATLLCVLIGFPLAYGIAFRGGRYKTLLLLLVVAPFFTSFLIRTLSWKLILADDGWIVGTLQAARILGENGRLLATPVAVIAGLTYNFLPFMVLPLYASLEKIDRRLIEASSDLYASPVRGFLAVTWPLSLPGVVAGTLLTFIPAAGDYINAQLLGSPNQRMVGNVIQNLFTDANDYPAAGALSVLLMLLILAMVLVYVRRAGTEELL